jgi:hypothetical protein
MKQFFFERDGKEYTITQEQGKLMVNVMDPEKDNQNKFPATWMETCFAYQVMSYMFFRTLKDKS